MEQGNSLRLVPSVPPKSTKTTEPEDILQYGLRSVAAEVQSYGGLKPRLENWEATQDNLRLTMLRDIQGLHAPMRLLMERKIVASVPGLPRSNLHLDILMGRDELIDPFDVSQGMETHVPLDPHAEMWKRRRFV